MLRCFGRFSRFATRSITGVTERQCREGLCLTTVGSAWLSLRSDLRRRNAVGRSAVDRRALLLTIPESSGLFCLVLGGRGAPRGDSCETCDPTERRDCIGRRPV